MTGSLKSVSSSGALHLVCFLYTWTGKSQLVSVHNVMVMSVFLEFGVPQGSFAGGVGS